MNSTKKAGNPKGFQRVPKDPLFLYPCNILFFLLSMEIAEEISGFWGAARGPISTWAGPK